MISLPMIVLYEFDHNRNFFSIAVWGTACGSWLGSRWVVGEWGEMGDRKFTISITRLTRAQYNHAHGIVVGMGSSYDTRNFSRYH